MILLNCPVMWAKVWVAPQAVCSCRYVCLDIWVFGFLLVSLFPGWLDLQLVFFHSSCLVWLVLMALTSHGLAYICLLPAIERTAVHSEKHICLFIDSWDCLLVSFKHMRFCNKLFYWNNTFLLMSCWVCCIFIVRCLRHEW